VIRVRQWIPRGENGSSTAYRLGDGPLDLVRFGHRRVAGVGDLSDPGGDAPGTDGQQLVLDENTSSGTKPVSDVLGGDEGPGEGGAPAGSVQVLGAQASGGLPVTGLGLLGTFVLGLMFMASGAALRRGGIEPN
jgi:hypothetical protein